MGSLLLPISPREHHRAFPEDRVAKPICRTSKPRGLLAPEEEVPRHTMPPPMHTPGAGQHTSADAAHSEGADGGVGERSPCAALAPTRGWQRPLTPNVPSPATVITIIVRLLYYAELPQPVREGQFTEAVVAVYCWSQMFNDIFST